MSNFPITLPPPPQPVFPTTPPGLGTPSFDIEITPPLQTGFAPLDSPESPTLPPDADAGLAGLNAYQLAVIGAEGVDPFQGSLADWLALYAPADDLQSWHELVNNPTEPPVLHTITPVIGGAVWTYLFGATAYFRHIPSPYLFITDTFYASFAAGVLSDPIVSRGISL